MFEPAYVGVILIGLLHGLEPGHGWPAAVLYSVRRKNPISCGALSSSIIALGHFVSSVAVVVAYVFLQSWLRFDAPFIKYVAAALLLFLAYRLLREKADEQERQHGHIHEGQPEIEHEHEHEHSGQACHTHRHKHTTGIILSLWALAWFAFILGFAHEEEFALLALVAGGVDAFTLMIIYGLSVTAALIATTLVAIKVARQLQSKLAPYEKHIPKISAAILATMAVIIVFW